MAAEWRINGVASGRQAKSSTDWASCRGETKHRKYDKDKTEHAIHDNKAHNSKKDNKDKKGEDEKKAKSEE